MCKRIFIESRSSSAHIFLGRVAKHHIGRGRSFHVCRMSSAVYDLNDANQTFELAQPVPAQPAAAPAARGSAESADMAALVKQAAALILQPQAAVRVLQACSRIALHARCLHPRTRQDAGP